LKIINKQLKVINQIKMKYLTLINNNKKIKMKYLTLINKTNNQTNTKHLLPINNINKQIIQYFMKQIVK